MELADSTMTESEMPSSVCQNSAPCSQPETTMGEEASCMKEFISPGLETASEDAGMWSGTDEG